LVILGVDSNTARLDPGAARCPARRGPARRRPARRRPSHRGPACRAVVLLLSPLAGRFVRSGCRTRGAAGTPPGRPRASPRAWTPSASYCSGLSLFAWAHAGVALGHYTGSQWTAGRHVAQSDLQPGDLVFFATDTADPATIHHVGLYIGGGDMISAPHTGDVVRVELPLCQPPAPSAESASSASFGPRASDRGLPGCACQPVSRTAPM